MAQHYSNGLLAAQPSSHGRHYHAAASSSSSSSSPFRDRHDSSLLDDLFALVAHAARSLRTFWHERGRDLTVAFLAYVARQLRRNLTVARLLSLPHLLVAFWVVVLLWGERWVFQSAVSKCHWSNWESWPPEARPHHLVFIADPQLIDPHSYPGRPWPLSSLTVLVTDNYLRRSYLQLQLQLHPDTLFFLGDLFDGGREWKTAHGDFRDPEWSRHPVGEQKYVKSWNKKYGEDFWLREYARFGRIFVDPWNAGGADAGPGQRRGGTRRLIASLPGNHDLGFGSEVKVPVRNRFETYFGEANRVDVIANHTFVSVDTVSLSARTSAEAGRHDLRAIYMPAEVFLKGVQFAKKKAVERELRSLRGGADAGEVVLRFDHRIEDADRADFRDAPHLTLDEANADLPSILLSHVPLYRPPGTPCGPLRERWPPTPPPRGQEGPLVPDHRNAISVTRGYQYQNVLSEQDSIDLIRRVGNVKHVFSGDDHDYCEVVHDEKQGNAPEITVKSMSMAMGVPTPGFLMVSLYNPVDAHGRPLRRAGGEEEGKTAAATFQTHLCLLPRMSSVIARYAAFAVVCLAALAVRALLVPALHLTPFALEPEPAVAVFGRRRSRRRPRRYGNGSGGGSSNGGILPVFKAKVEDDEEYALPAAGYSASRSLQQQQTRDRGTSGALPAGVKANGLAAQARNSPSSTRRHKDHQHHHQQRGSSRWGWAGSSGLSSRGPPRIEIRDEEDEDDDDDSVAEQGGGERYDGGKRWKAASPLSARKHRAVSVVVRELWTTTWRVAWMVVLFWFYLAYKG